LVEVLAPGVAREVSVPGINIAQDLVIVARGVVFNQSRGIQLFRQLVNGGDPFLGFGKVRALFLVLGNAAE